MLNVSTVRLQKTNIYSCESLPLQKIMDQFSDLPQYVSRTESQLKYNRILHYMTSLIVMSIKGIAIVMVKMKPAYFEPSSPSS